MTAAAHSSVARNSPSILPTLANRTGGDNVVVRAKELLAFMRENPQMFSAMEVGLVVLYHVARAQGANRAEAVDVAASFQIGAKAKVDARECLNLLLGRKCA